MRANGKAVAVEGWGQHVLPFLAALSEASRAAVVAELRRRTELRLRDPHQRLPEGRLSRKVWHKNGLLSRRIILGVITIRTAKLGTVLAKEPEVESFPKSHVNDYVLRLIEACISVAELKAMSTASGVGISDRAAVEQ